MRPWSDRPIQDCLESLEYLPPQLLRIEPHPYASVGAPYGQGKDPFRLRSGVVRRLLQAQDLLRQRAPELCFAIFDAWRPISVQAFMVNYTIDQLCRERGVDREDPRQEADLQTVESEVGRFWAPPSRNPQTPPPHSTRVEILRPLPPTARALLWISPLQPMLASCWRWAHRLMPLELFQNLITSPIHPIQRSSCFINGENFCAR